MSGSKGKEYGSLAIRDAMLINGRGTPPYGPVDIVVKDGKIADIINVDSISLARYKNKRGEGDHIIDAKGMYVTPGFVDMHVHINIADEKCGPKGTEYAYNLCLAHGVTTVRTCGFGTDDKLLEHKRLSDANKITAPRLVVLGSWPAEVHTVDEARDAARKLSDLGVDGIKIIPRPHVTPEILEAMTDEARALELPAGVAIHIAQNSELDALDVTFAGMDKICIEHTYGIPQAAMPGTQNFPPEYNYSNEVDRFRWDGYIWHEADVYEEEVMDVLDIMIENGTVWDPTMVVYEGHRDYQRVKSLPWHEKYTVRQLWEAYSPSPGRHATHFFDWKTSDEIAWKEKYQIWMKYVKYFFDNGGTLVAGSDTAFIYALFGFALIRELELYQEAGIHPIDVIQIATTNAHATLGDEERALGVRKGAPADLAIIDGNPLDNFKVMYGTGVMRYSPDRKSVTHGGGVRWTVKGGVVFDCAELLRDVEEYVNENR
ncbi:MAG: amidohydrolase family protein [Candidatus Bathyarchaeota archaeon]|nr:amidohydrolase family protein [Candidatus Bathyarchaeota archaeon]